MSLDLEQQYAVKALEEIQRICSKNGLKLYLLAGSTLGAVRHRGMIPWDNDIDVGLTYDDWYKLRKIIRAELDPEFTYIDESVNENYNRFFGKILYNNIGCVDLFLIAKWPLSNLRSFINWRIRKFSVEGYKYEINKINKQKFKDAKSLKDVIHIISRYVDHGVYFVMHPFVNKYTYLKMAKAVEASSNHLRNYRYINLYSIYPRKKEYIKREWIEEPSEVIFENKNYLTIGDTHAYLTHLYGDYMTPPPQKEREMEKKTRHTERFGE